jgi:class 3 adenylate cyclase
VPAGAWTAISVLAALLAIAVALLAITTLRLRRTTVLVAELEAEVDQLAAVTGTAQPRSLPAAERALRTVIGTAVRVREQGVSGLLVSSIDDLSRWATDDRSEIMRLAAADGSVTVFFSDIEGSTALNTERGDEGWVRVLIAHDTVVRAHVERRGGHIVKSQGDGFMIVFTSPVDAVRTGLGVQRALKSRLKVRIGVHEGTVVARDGDYFGQTVAMAARVAAQAVGGEILVTSPVWDDLTAAGFRLTAREPVELKGLPGRHALWRGEKRRG